MLRDVAWGELDIMVVDMPPGTGDAQLTMAQQVPLAGAVIVSTPQDIALIDARKGLSMFQKVNVPVLGIIENMSYFLCPHCGGRSEIFSHGGARREAARLGTDFLGEVPLDLAIREQTDAGRPPVVAEPDGPQALAYLEHRPAGPGQARAAGGRRARDRSRRSCSRTEARVGGARPGRGGWTTASRRWPRARPPAGSAAGVGGARGSSTCASRGQPTVQRRAAGRERAAGTPSTRRPAPRSRLAEAGGATPLAAHAHRAVHARDLLHLLFRPGGADPDRARVAAQPAAGAAGARPEEISPAAGRGRRRPRAGPAGGDRRRSRSMACPAPPRAGSTSCRWR